MRCYLIAIVLLLPFLLAGQELSVQFGATQLQLKDQQLSPMRLSAMRFTGGLAFAKCTDERYQRFQLSYTEGWLQSRISGTFNERSNSSFLYAGQFTHHELWRLPFCEKLECYAGLVGQLSANYREHHYLSSITEDQFEGVVGVGAAASLAYPLTEQSSLQTVVAFPFLNYVMSKRYSPRYFDRDMLLDWRNVKGPGQFTDLQFEARWQQSLGKRWGFMLIYQTRYYRYQRMLFLSHQWLLGLSLKLNPHE